MEPISNSRTILTKYKRNTNVQFPKATKQMPSQAPEDKLFQFDSQDHYIKKYNQYLSRILTQHGWKLTKKFEVATLHWVYCLTHNTFSQINKDSKINHFPHSYLLTTKLGLCKTLKGQRAALVDHLGYSHSTFYPRSYDLRQSLAYEGSEQNEDFINDYRRTAILNLLKKVMIAIEIQNQSLFKELHCQTMLLPSRKTNLNLLKSLQALYQSDTVYVSSINKDTSVALNGKIFQGLLWYFSLMFTLDCENTEESIDSSEIDYLITYSLLDPPYKSLQKHYASNQALIKYPSVHSLRLFFQIYRQAINRFKWFRADGLRNVWVVKANDSSRGRSITLVSTLQQLRTLNSGTKLIQKYVQDAWIHRQYQESITKAYPFLKKLSGKKFDIRIWVLVRSFAPLQAFIYKEGYLRISQEVYQLSELDRNCTHLTNFSVNWKASSSDPENSYVLLSDFLEYLDLQGIKKKNHLNKQIQDLVLHTLQTTDLFVTRSDNRCFEFYGYDILLDSQLKPWLLEVNMSPACKQRGRLANQLQIMGSGLLSLVGLIPKNIHQNKWTPITNIKEPCTILRNKIPGHIKGHQFGLVSTKSQCILKPVISKCFSIRSGKEEEIDLSRVSSIFPNIANVNPSHIKNQKLDSSSIISSLIIVGNKLSGKRLRIFDKFLNTLDAVKTFERNYNRFMKKKNNNICKDMTKKQSLCFLKLYECLVLLTRKAKLRAFKRVRKCFNKKSVSCKHKRLA